MYLVKQYRYLQKTKNFSLVKNLQDEECTLTECADDKVMKSKGLGQGSGEDSTSYFD